MSNNPFNYVKSINEKTEYIDNVRDYNAYLTNQALSYSMDTIMFAQELNQFPNLPAEAQYDLLYNSVRKGKRYSKWYKAEEVDNLEMVMEYYDYSKEKALAALQVLSQRDIKEIKQSLDRGGNTWYNIGVRINTMCIQFNKADCSNLINGIEAYQDRTGSEYMWDVFEALKKKVQAYEEEVTTD